MAERPAASVVVVNHDYADYLPAAIDSALAQTAPGVEVVVVDDGSTDGSRELIAAYGDRVTAVLTPNRGQTSAMAAGLEASRGEVVCFLDADDVLSAGALAATLPLFDDPRVVKVHWPLAEIDAGGRSAGRLWPREPLPEGDLLERLLEEGPANCPFPPTSGNAFRRSFLDAVAPLPALERECGVGSAGADGYLSMFALAAGRVGRLTTPLGGYRVHGSNDYAAGSDLAATVERSVRIADRHLAALVEHLAGRGIAADVERWRRRSWFHRLAAVLEAAEGLVEPGASWVLVDEGVTGIAGDPRWRVRPLLERDGVHWGPAASAEEAIAGVERLRQEGADAIVFTWLSRWWLDAFPELLAHLRARHEQLIDTELVLAFDLRSVHPGRPRAARPPRLGREEAGACA